MKNKLIGVYGTLRKGCGNHRVMGSSELLGTVVTNPSFTMFNNGGFPFVFPSGETPITLEIYNVSDQGTLRDIYGLEGYTGERNHPRNWYDTVDVETEFGTAEIFVCKNPPNLPVVASGDWTKRHE